MCYAGDAILDTHTSHVEHIWMCPPWAQTPPYAVYTNTRTHTTNLLLPDEDTRVVKALPRHTRDTDTDLRNGFADAHRLTEARGYTHAVRTQKHTETHGHAWTPQAQTHVRVRPTDPHAHPFICSRSVGGTSPVCSDSSGLGTPQGRETKRDRCVRCAACSKVVAGEKDRGGRRAFWRMGG